MMRGDGPKRMKLSTLLWIFGVWLFLNAVFPLFINSLERLYQPSIDAVVRWVTKWVATILLALLQLLLIVLFAPNILVVGILERICPRIFQVQWVKETYVYPTMHLVLTGSFWPSVAADFRRWRNLKKKKRKEPNNTIEGTPR